jgi:hypothetical protein
MSRLLFACIGMCLASALGCDESLCGNRIAQEVASPGGTFRAVVFERDCGATTGFSTQISILPATGRLKNETGNVFVAEGKKGVPLDSRGAMHITAEWRGDNALIVSYPSAAQVFQKVSDYQGVRVTYVAD